MSQLAAPYIPESAPFSPEQREWLNGLLAGLFSTAAPAPPQVNTVAVSVLFASQSGTAERLAKKMAKRLKESGYASRVESLETITPAALAQTQHAVFFVSTYGEGDPPESALSFRDLLFADHAPRLEGLRYTVFSLGDRNYEHFCRFGIELDERLKTLGAATILPRVESDVDVDEPFSVWSSQVLTGFRQPPTSPAPPAAVDAEAASTPVVTKAAHTRDQPFHAEVVDKRLLTRSTSSKQTVHVAFDLSGGEMQYEAGDACGVLAHNDPVLVEEILNALPFSATETITLPKFGVVTVEQALHHHLQPSRLTRKTLQAFAGKTQCHTLTTLLAGETSELDAYMHGRGFIDLLHAYPGAITQAAELADMLPRLAPRLYSISSSPKAHGRELHCTIAVVHYHSHGRERKGVASAMLGHRVEIGARVPIYLQPNKRFRLPADSSKPIIMIGPGTGIAPFRAFLHERQALGHTGPNWLFFGERSADTDFLYCCELRAFVADGHLSRLDTAFSRDQAHKVYVQDRMLEAGADFFRWLEEGASVYVCGDASRMAKDVDQALHHIVEMHGALKPDAAQEYVAQLHEQNRYHRDVY